MKTVELSDENYATLRRLAADRNLTPEALVAAFIRDSHPPLDRSGLLSLLIDPDFRSLADPAERYLAVLAWCAKNHARDFADFISHQESGHRYLILSPDEIQEVREHNQARQIDGTQFWAVMTIDPVSKRRFVRRLLEFVGCRDETVSEACGALGLSPSSSENSRRLGAA